MKVRNKQITKIVEDIFMWYKLSPTAYIFYQGGELSIEIGNDGRFVDYINGEFMDNDIIYGDEFTQEVLNACGYKMFIFLAEILDIEISKIYEKEILYYFFYNNSTNFEPVELKISSKDIWKRKKN